MIHLNDEQLYNLAQLTMEMQPYNEEEMKQMEHLKECENCYDKFCGTLALLEVTEESGFVVLSEIYSEPIRNVSTINENVLAIVKVVRDKIEKTISVVMEQIEGMEAVFQLEPSLAFASRGGGERRNTVFKLEDIEDEKTFLMFDKEKGELLVQINMENIDYKKVKVLVEFKGGQRHSIPMEENGKFVCGIMKNIPQDDFKIYIEKAEL